MRFPMAALLLRHQVRVTGFRCLHAHSSDYEAVFMRMNRADCRNKRLQTDVRKDAYEYCRVMTKYFWRSFK